MNIIQRQGWGLLKKLSTFSRILQNYRNSDSLLNLTFIFDRFRRPSPICYDKERWKWFNRCSRFFCERKFVFHGAIEKHSPSNLDPWCQKKPSCSLLRRTFRYICLVSSKRYPTSNSWQLSRQVVKMVRSLYHLFQLTKWHIGFLYQPISPSCRIHT